VYFGLKQARAALFAGLFLVLLFASNYVHIEGVYRYDFLFVGAVVIQMLLISTKLETKDEAKTILLFHLVGLVLELYKTSPLVGSWSYPEAGYLKVFGVPLYSGFMYAAVGSYIAGAWKVLKIKLIHPPKYWHSVVLCFFIYLNFFTNHFIRDYRLILFAAVGALYFRTKIEFTPRIKSYCMPLVLGFFLVGFFVWLAENIATFYGAWKYPYQVHAWRVVSFNKITSWFLLVIICFIIVAYLKHIKANRVKALAL
jgi:uncharacterized membrane protein YoaT (DUF817 family)